MRSTIFFAAIGGGELAQMLIALFRNDAWSVFLCGASGLFWLLVVAPMVYRATLLKGDDNA
jgi:hypothetical protein